jgi:hypothetical protein
MINVYGMSSGDVKHVLRGTKAVEVVVIDMIYKVNKRAMSFQFNGASGVERQHYDRKNDFSLQAPTFEESGVCCCLA